MDFKLQKEPDSAEISLVMSHAFPGISEYRLEPLSGGMFNTTYTLYIGTDKYVLRFGPCDYSLLYPYEKYLMDAECQAYKLLSDAGIPTSEVVYKDTSKSLIDRDFMIVRFIESTDLYKLSRQGLITPEEKKDYYRSVGRTTRLMSDRIVGSKFGRLGYIVHGEGADRWSDFIRRDIGEYADCVRAHCPAYYNEDELSALCHLADRFISELDEIKEAHFNHCDLWAPNILQKKDPPYEIAAIIDPDRATMGDPDFDIASGWMMNDEFFEGYGRRPATDRSTKIRMSIYKILFCLLDGYFQLIQADNREIADQDKADVLRYLSELDKLEQSK